MSRLAEIVKNNVPENNKCEYCGTDLECKEGFNAPPFSVYVHSCKICSASYLRILKFFFSQEKSNAEL